ncbi:MAG: hypothetical protein KGQ41_01850 [Alphaproteobacteria bacterium]|nr:hypothetical protein [Alphaproteobacteria bacterium]
MAETLAQNPDADIAIYVFVSDNRDICFFHDKPFSKTLSWLEYNPDRNMIEFVMEDGDVKDFGVPLPDKYRADVVASKNCYVIQQDPETKKVIKGKDLPLITQGLPYY